MWWEDHIPIFPCPIPHGIGLRHPFSILYLYTVALRTYLWVLVTVFVVFLQDKEKKEPVEKMETTETTPTNSQEATPTQEEVPPTPQAAVAEGGKSSEVANEEKMDTAEVVKPASKGGKPASDAVKPASEGSEKAEGGKEKKMEPEPDFEMLSNPARVLPQQVGKDHSWVYIVLIILLRGERSFSSRSLNPSKSSEMHTEWKFLPDGSRFIELLIYLI